MLWLICFSREYKHYSRTSSSLWRQLAVAAYKTAIRLLAWVSGHQEVLQFETKLVKSLCTCTYAIEPTLRRRCGPVTMLYVHVHQSTTVMIIKPSWNLVFQSGKSHPSFANTLIGKATICWILVSHPLPTWNFAPASNSSLCYYFILCMRTSDHCLMVAFCLSSTTFWSRAGMLNFTVNNCTACHALVPWQIQWILQTSPFMDSIAKKQPVTLREDRHSWSCTALLLAEVRNKWIWWTATWRQWT